MIVECGIRGCGYNQNGYCGKGVIKVNENGLCSYLTKGTNRWLDPIADIFKENARFIDADDVVEVKEDNV